MASIDLPDAGTMRETINVTTPVAVPDGIGGYTKSTTARLSSVRARITPVRGQEQLIAQGLQAIFSYQIWIRSSQAARQIIESDLIFSQHTNTTYRILSISNPDEQNIFLLITAVKVNQ